MTDKHIYNEVELRIQGVEAAVAASFAAVATDTASVNNLVNSVARTATADGTGTGTIATGSDFVTVTCDDANKIVVLPTPTPGVRLSLINGATGYELRTSAPATVGINGGTGVDAESAIAASTHVWCECSTATNWICWSRVAAGTLSVVQVAAP